MRIAIVYPHTMLGTETPPGDALAVLIWELGRRLATTDEVTVYGRRGAGQSPTEALEGVRLRRFRPWPDHVLGQLRRLDGVLFRDRWPFRTTALYYPAFFHGVVRALRAARPDVVHVHAVPNFLPAIRRAAPGARLVFHAHDHRIADFDPARMRRLLEAADAILACSRFVADAMVSRLPTLAERTEAFHNGADDAFFAAERSEAARAGGARILFVGRLSPEKGVHTLIEAFARIAGDHPAVTLDLVGPDQIAPIQFVDPFGSEPLFEAWRPFYERSGAYASHLRRLSSGGLGGRVRFRGPVPNARLPAVYGGADVFVFPPIWHEPFGMPVVEAMAAGLPVVATRSGGITETVRDGETGILVDRADPAGLAAALDRLLRDPGLRREMGRSGRARASRRFSWDVLAMDLRARYERRKGVAHHAATSARR